MSTKNHKLRKALGNLFKARGENIEATKIPQKKQSTKPPNGEKLQKDNLNGGLKDNGKGHTVTMKTKEKNQDVKVKVKQRNKNDKEHIVKKHVLKPDQKDTSAKTNYKPKKDDSRNAKNTNVPKKLSSKNEDYQFNRTPNVPKTNKANILKSSNKKKIKLNVEVNTSHHPPGYFVLNRKEPKLKKNLSNLKENSELAAKKNKSSIENKKNNKQKNEATLLENKPKLLVQSKKRKGKKDDDGPQSKVYKNQNGHFNNIKTTRDKSATSVGDFKELSKFACFNKYSDEDSNSSWANETDTTEEYDDGFSFESDDLDDTYSEQSESENSFTDSESASSFAISESESSFTDTDSLNSIHDPDYELPKTVLEDHIIHQGLAVKYDFNSEHDIQFDEYNDSAQIVELPSQVNIVEQHESLNVEHLRTLELKYVKKLTFSSNAIPAIHSQAKDEEETEECPELVPIDEVDFRLWTSGISMDDEIFSQCSDYANESDAESITAAEGNINRKYLENLETDSDESVESFIKGDCESNLDFIPQKKQKMWMNFKADVVLAKEQENLAPFELQLSEKNISEQSSLSEIIAQTEGLVDASKVVIKKAVIVDELKQNDTLEEAEHMRSCAQSEIQEILNVDKHFTQFTGIDVSVNSSDVSDTPDTPIEGFLDESVTNADTQLEKAAEDTQMKKFKTLFFDSIDSHSVLVLLKTPFYIYGTVKATLIAGSAEVFGYKLEKWKTHELYSPRGVCAFPILPKSLNAAEFSSNTEDILATIGTFSSECEFYPQQLETMLCNFEPGTDAILLLTRNDDANNIKHMMQSHVKENIFPAQIPQSRQFYTSEFLLDCMINVNTEYPLHIPPQWYNLRLDCNSKFLLVGGKSVGKSTLLRFLINQHLNKFPAILVIDLDIGQPEIFASQAVSCALIQQPLLGPGFFYNIQPDKAYCVAHCDVVICAHRYLPAVLELLKYCNEEPRYHNIPCIVNTMGYNKGFGAELMAVIIEHLRPTNIVQLQSNVPINNFDYLFETHVVPTIERNNFDGSNYAATNIAPLNHRLHVMPSAVLQQGRYQREWQMSAKDMRYVMLLTQLSKILDEHSEILNRKQTYCIDMDLLKITNPYSNRTTPNEVAKSLISNLVYLGHIDSNSTERDTIECLGVGIVRAVDWPARKLYLITALPLDRLRYVNALITGGMPLPASMLTLQNLAQNVEVPFVQNVADEATSRAIRQFYSRT